MEVAVCSLRLIFQVGNNYIVEAVEFTGVHFRLIILPSITSSLSFIENLILLLDLSQEVSGLGVPVEVEVFLEDAASLFNMFDRLFAVLGVAVGFSQLVVHLSVPGFEEQGFLEGRDGFVGAIDLQVQVPKVEMVEVIVGIIFDLFDVFVMLLLEVLCGQFLVECFIDDDLVDVVARRVVARFPVYGINFQRPTE